MFTLKLYTSHDQNDGTLSIVSAAQFVIYRYSNGSAQISAWSSTSEGAPYYVGTPGDPVGDVTIYDHAIIENAAGRTTEIVRQIPDMTPASIGSRVIAPNFPNH